MVAADLDRPETVAAAFAGAKTVFAMTTFSGPQGPEGEVEHGRVIGTAAGEVGVGHVVYSSVGGAERETGIPHFESKRRVEEHLLTLGLRTTFIRPTFFMENFAGFLKPDGKDGALVVSLPLPAGIPLQTVAARDIGQVAAVAALQPDRVGPALEIAGDELTGEEVAATLGAVAGVRARYEALPLEALAANPDQQSMFAWFARRPAYQADRKRTRELVPDVWDLRDWRRNQ